VTAIAKDRRKEIRLEHRQEASRARPTRWRRAGIVLLVVVLVLVAAFLLAPRFVRDYVNRTLDRNQQYAGLIGEVKLNPWRGAYSIDDVRLLKRAGNVPVPFFSAKRVQFLIETEALLHGKAVGRVRIEEPELNFVDSKSGARSQTGSNAPWLAVLRDLYPFKIDSAEIVDGRVHFRAFDTDPPVDVYLSRLEGSIEDLTNVYDETKPLVATLTAKAIAMDQAKLECRMKLDPFSYRPTFQLALRLLGLDVTKTNALARAYGNFDFKQGWFDLVVEIDSKEGAVNGYVKPLFRNLKIFDPKKDLQDPIRGLWKALVGVVASVFRNPPRDQVGTLIPFSGRIESPDTDYLATIGNLLRNAFVRAYLPKLQGVASDIDGLQFEPAPVSALEALK
jgi:hypothetical protein